MAAAPAGKWRARIAPAPELRRAAALSVLSPLLWIPQAAILATAVAGLIAGRALPLWTVAAFLALTALRLACDWLAQSAAQSAARRLIARERAALLSRAVRRAPSGAGEDAAGLASLMGEKIALLGSWAERFLPASMRSRLLPLVILAVVAAQSWSAALALAMTGPLIPVFMALIGSAAQSVAAAQLVETGALNRLLIDRIAALGDIRLLGAGDRAGADLAARSAALRESTMKVLRLAFLSSTVLEFMAALGVALVAVQMGLSLLGLVSWGGWGGPVTPFGAIFVLLIAPDFYQPLRDLATAWHDRAAAQAVLEELAADAAAGHPGIVGAVEAGASGPRLAAPLSWSGLVLRPGPGRELLLPDGEVGAGEAVALMAPSGAGKSSLLAALAGLVPVAAGRVTMGGVTLDTESAPRIRAALGWLPQTPRFPAESLRAFLTGGADLPEDVLTDALALACAEGVVAALPQGLATRLGEAGGGVSGGEARRLTLARALIAPPAVLLADEPTSDLDPEAARAVTAALLNLRARGTALLVATHDAALAGAMDRRIEWRADGAARVCDVAADRTAADRGAGQAAAPDPAGENVTEQGAPG